MKLRITVLLCLMSLLTYGQGHDSAGTNNQLRFNRGVSAFGQELIIPNDTTMVSFWPGAPAIAIKNGLFYYYNGSRFVTPTASGSGVTLINTDPPLVGGPITSTGTISMPQAAGQVSGYLYWGDWLIFNGKQDALGYTPLNADDTTRINAALADSMQVCRDSFEAIRADIGSGSIGGSISETQIPYGGATPNTIEGNSSFTYEPSGFFTVGFDGLNNYIEINAAGGIYGFGDIHDNLYGNNIIMLPTATGIQGDWGTLGNPSTAFKIDFGNTYIEMGDVQNRTNGTKFKVDDLNQLYNFSKLTAPASDTFVVVADENGNLHIRPIPTGLDSTTLTSIYRDDTGKLRITAAIPTNNNQLTNGAGYITGNQTITLSGQASGSGTTSIPVFLDTSVAHTWQRRTTFNNSIQVGRSGGTAQVIIDTATDGSGAITIRNRQTGLVIAKGTSAGSDYLWSVFGSSTSIYSQLRGNATNPAAEVSNGSSTGKYSYDHLQWTNGTYSFYKYMPYLTGNRVDSGADHDYKDDNITTSTTTPLNGVLAGDGVHIYTVTVGSGSVTSVTANALSPIFTSTTANSTTTPAISYSLTAAAAHSYLGNNTGGSAAPAYNVIDYSELSGTPTIQTTINGTTIANNTNNTITASANTLTTTTLNPTVVNSSLTKVGTIATGVWNATKIGLAYGGTNSDLSATGGAANYLKQPSSGAAITVGTIPYTDITGTPSLSGYLTTVNVVAPVASNGGTTPTVSINAIPASSVLANTSGSSSTPNSNIIYTISPTATTLGERDANANFSDNNTLENGQKIVTAGGTTTFTVSSPAVTHFTGVLGQTLTMPVTSTLALYQSWTIYNESSGSITVNSSGGNLIQTMAAGTTLVISDTATGHTTAVDWAVDYGFIVATSGTVTSFSSGNLSPLFTTSVGTATTTPSLTYSLTNAGAHTFFGNFTGSSGAPSYSSPTLASADFANQGTTTTVLHGNASGNPSFAAVGTSDISANAVTLAKMDNSNATANKVLMSGASASPTWSTPTYPNASATAGKVIISDGTNYVASTPTYPNASATAGKVMISDGTNFVASTPAYPNSSATSRKILVSDGTNFVASTETWALPSTSGNVLTSDGTNWVNTVAYNSASSASTILQRDSHQNGYVNSLGTGIGAVIPLANATVTYTVDSPSTHVYSGSTSGQIVKLPVTSTIQNLVYTIVNTGSQTITVQSSGGTAFSPVIGSGQTAQFIVDGTGHTDLTDWLYLSGANTSTYTFGTGLNNTSGTITNNLSVGVSGGQTAIGGTAAADALTLEGSSTANTGNSANPAIIIGANTFNGSNTAQVGTKVAATVNQTSTAGFEALKISTTETAVGSGTQALISGYAGASGTTQKLLIDNTGTMTVGKIGTGAVIGGPTMTLGSDANYDVYYRNSSGVLTRLAAGTDGQILTTHSTTSAPTFSDNNGGWTVFTVTGSNFTTTNATATDVTGLVTGTLSISSTYIFHAYLQTASSSNAGDKFAVNVTVAPTRILANYTGATSASASVTCATIANNTLSTALVTAAQDGYVDIVGSFTTAGSGSPVFSIQIAKVTSGTATVYTGSRLEIKKTN